MLAFFLNCKKKITVDVKVEGVLFNNGFKPPLMGLEETLRQSDILGYPEVVKTFLAAAIEHKRLIDLEAQRMAKMKCSVNTL